MQRLLLCAGGAIAVAGFAGFASFALGRTCDGHRRYYDSRTDETFCTSCAWRWRDSDMSGRKAAVFHPTTGWTEHVEQLPPLPLPLRRKN